MLGDSGPVTLGRLALGGLYGLAAAPDLARNRWRRLGARFRLMRDCRRRFGALSRLEAWWLSRARALERARAEGRPSRYGHGL